MNACTPASQLKARKTPNQHMMLHADLSAQVLSWQIAEEYTAIARSKILPKVAGDLNIGWREIMILTIANRLRPPVQATRIAKILRFDPATVSRGLQSLIAAGTMRVEDNPTNRRQDNLFITDLGQDLAIRYKNEFVKTAVTCDPSYFDQLQHKDRMTASATFQHLRHRAWALAKITADKRRIPNSIHPLAPLNLMNMDYLFFYTCSQISLDYLIFLSRHVVPKMKLAPTRSLRDLRILGYVDFLDGAATPGQVAKLMRFDAATVTRSVNTLRKSGHITLTTSAQDSRSKLIALTDDGFNAVNEYRDVSNAEFESVGQELGLDFGETTRLEVLEVLYQIRGRAVSFNSCSTC